MGNFPQHFPQEFPTSISHKISHKIFPQDFPARISHKIFPQEIPSRFSHNNFPQHFPQDFPARISCKNFVQHFPATERSQNTILLASTQAVYKAPHSTVRERQQLTSSSGSSRKSQSVRLEHNTVESVAASCTYASVINASKDILCIHCVQT